MPQSVLAQSALKGSTACPGQERPERGHPDVRTHASEEVFNKFRCSRVERGLRATDRLQGIKATSPGVEGAGAYPKPPCDSAPGVGPATPEPAGGLDGTVARQKVRKRRLFFSLRRVQGTRSANSSRARV